MFENRPKSDKGYWYVFGRYADGTTVNRLYVCTEDTKEEDQERINSLHQWIEEYHPDCIKAHVFWVTDRDIEAFLEDY